jgi:signal peptidase II
LRRSARLFWFFVCLGTFAAFDFVWMLCCHAGQQLFNLEVAPILGGAPGNVNDRPILGAWFSSFNIADSAITLGAACLNLHDLLRVRHGR